MRAVRLLAGSATALVGIATIASSLSPNVPARRRAAGRRSSRAAPSAVAHGLGVAGGLVVAGLAVGVLAGRRSSARAAAVVLGLLAVVHVAKGLDFDEAALGLALGRRRCGGSCVEATPSRLRWPRSRRSWRLAGGVRRDAHDAAAPGHSADLGGERRARRRRRWRARSRRRPASGWRWRGGGGAVVVAARDARAGALARRPRRGEHRARRGAGRGARRRLVRAVRAAGRQGVPLRPRRRPGLPRADASTAVVAGDPVGPPGSAAPILARSSCARADAAGTSCCSARARSTWPATRRSGCARMQIGLEAVVDPRAFSLDAPAAKTVRKAVRRVRAPRLDGRGRARRRSSTSA